MPEAPIAHQVNQVDVPILTHKKAFRAAVAATLSLISLTCANNTKYTPDTSDKFKTAVCTPDGLAAFNYNYPTDRYPKACGGNLFDASEQETYNRMRTIVSQHFAQPIETTPSSPSTTG